jgi:Flp pilus assembly protein TadG
VTPRARTVWRDDDGAITLMVTVMAVAFLALAGLVFDGARALHARGRAVAYAEEAARAGAQAGIDRTSAELSLVPPVAKAAALRYCADAQAAGATTLVCDPAQIVVTNDCVTVHASMTIPTGLLGLVGINSLPAQGVGRAQAFEGLDAARQQLVKDPCP